MMNSAHYNDIVPHPLLYTTLSQNVEGGVYLNIQFVLRVYAPLFNVGLTIFTMIVPNSYIASLVLQNISDGY